MRTGLKTKRGVCAWESKHGKRSIGKASESVSEPEDTLTLLARRADEMEAKGLTQHALLLRKKIEEIKGS